MVFIFKETPVKSTPMGL